MPSQFPARQYRAGNNLMLFCYQGSAARPVHGQARRTCQLSQRVGVSSRAVFAILAECARNR